MIEFKHSLIPFDSSDAPPIEIQCTGSLSTEHHQVKLCFELTGTIEEIELDSLIPNPERSDNLWQTTCFEFFVKSDNSTNYWEYNLSPSSNWAIYGFSDYRKNRFDELSISNIGINIDMLSKNYKLSSILPLPKALHGQNLEIGISSVIQDKSGNIYYYALKHAKTHSKAEPDFHDKNCFSISINLES